MDRLQKLLQADLGDEYEVVAKIGSGGFATVYKVIEKAVEKSWAIKVYEKEIGNVESEVKFESAIHEAKMLSKLQYFRLPRFSDQIISQNPCVRYLKMDYVDGVSLESLNHGTFSEIEIIEWGKQLCEILHYLHNHSSGAIYYLDLKPANIMCLNHVDDLYAIKQITLVDFGIAIQKGNGDKKARKECSPLFASYEQLKANVNVDQRSDIYSLGATLYYLLSGKIYNETYKLEYDPKIMSRGLYEILKKCLYEDVNKRFTNAMELYQALSDVKQFDPLYQKNNKNKLLICFGLLLGASIAFLLAIGCNDIKTNQINQYYDYYITLGKSNIHDYEKIEYYYKALVLLPEKKQAYDEIIQVFKSDQVFEDQENKWFLKNIVNYLSEMKKDNQYADLCNEIAKLYFYYYDYGDSGDSLLIKQKEACFWFEEAITYWNHSNTLDYEIANIYYELFQLELLVQNVESNKIDKAYYHNYLNMKKLVNQIPLDADIPTIVIGKIAQIASCYVADYFYELKAQGIHKQELKNYINKIIMLIDCYPANEHSKVIYENIKQIISYIEDKLDTT